MLLFLSFFPLLLFFFILRFYPIWSLKYRGCDAYYFLITSEVFRESKRIPIIIPPYFLLEQQEQWYPPGFSIFLALFPEKWVKRNYWLVSNLLDSVILVLLYLWIGKTHGVVIGWLAGFAYASTPCIVLEYSALSSRPLGVLFAVGFLLSNYLWISGYEWALIIAVIFGFLLWFTHKLSMQLLWFLVPFFTIWYRDLKWLFPFLGSFILAVALGRQYFFNVLTAHREIVGFWGRNWRYLGAHQIRNSPVYGDGKAGTGYHRGNWLKSSITHTRRVFLYNPWIILIVFILPIWNQISNFNHFLFVWILGSYVWAGLTLYFNSLKALGEGTKYIKYAIPPSIVLAFSTLSQKGNYLALTMILFCFLVQLFFYLFTVREIRSNEAQTGVVDEELERVFELIRANNCNRIMCLPTHLATVTAYVTGKQVCWGTHTFGFHNVEDFFPVLRQPIAHFFGKYQLSHLLLDRQFAGIEELQVKPNHVLADVGKYILCSLDLDGVIKR
ncbi:MAG: hypothetical protein PVF10_07955 [Syntrophobacterales bacterium]|jgi:hypothetical protein